MILLTEYCTNKTPQLCSVLRHFCRWPRRFRPTSFCLTALTYRLSHRLHLPTNLIAIESSPITKDPFQKKKKHSSFKMDQPTDSGEDEWEYEYHETETEVHQPPPPHAFPS
jgi:hypothetical protein